PCPQPHLLSLKAHSKRKTTNKEIPSQQEKDNQRERSTSDVLFLSGPLNMVCGFDNSNVQFLKNSIIP
ncbi:hypothetical protein OFM39_28540, partial [Escherichia coli]|nr:hypothetical protein [Escherichia coli]